MPPDPVSIYAVPANAPTEIELMGTKPKFWFSRDEEKWLFKATRAGHGEHWAEVIAAGLAELLGIPHADYEFASWRDKEGVVNAGTVTRLFVADGFELVHGNELLAERDPNYPPEGARYVRTRQHTIEAVRGVVGGASVGFPIGWKPIPGIESAVDVFGGYLLLDAWIGNTDRHHENWALLVEPGQGSRHLAPTFDHASSLGAHLPDAQRSSRLASKDPAFRVAAYVQAAKARSALYLREGDAKPMPMLDAFQAWAQQAKCDAWVARLDSIEDVLIQELIDRMPLTEMTGPARAFAQAILKVNKERILATR